ncbi:hypothetical protein [Niallia sp. Krafla_26]|uniref:hypothetical protein n=1 Tax=Niallia sp. Krafla_26 TaxID=3064703 RepID=UPI003D186BDB
MKEKSSYCHQRYLNIEENLAFMKQTEMTVLVSKGTFQKWSLYGHFDYPLDPLDQRDKTMTASRCVLNI